MIGVFGGGVLSKHFQAWLSTRAKARRIFSSSEPLDERRDAQTSWTYFNLAEYDSINSISGSDQVKALESAVVFAGISNPNIVEEDLQFAIKVNLIHTIDLINTLSRAGIFFIFLSSVEVFDSPAASKEQSKPAPVNHYGFMKAAVERYILERVARAAIVRTTWNIPSLPVDDEESGRCPITLIYKSLLHENSRWARDYLTNPVLAEDTVGLVGEILDKQISGIFHSAGEAVFSRFELAQIIGDKAVKQQIRPVSCSFDELPSTITGRRARVSVLDTSETARKLSFEFSDIDPSVAKIVNRLEGM